MRALPILDPCVEPWDRMEGDARARHCARCEREVFDLSAVREAEAQAVVLLFASRGLCVRYTRDARGDIQHAPAPAPSPRRAGAIAAAVGAAMVGCAPAPPPVVPSPVPVVVASPEPPSAPAAPPVADSDRDGVPDEIDACPNEPGPVSPDPKRNGCPSMGVVVSQGEVVVLQTIRFAKGATRIQAESRAIVTELARLLGEHPEIRKVSVQGHASLDEQSPQRLGKSRAEAVIDALVAAKVERARLVATSFGRDRPLDDNARAAGRERNRRVDFHIEETASCASP
ncbi:outer membrane protein OmpA [Minicystis rosea]|nr:outer membrane protein OmpA [Minicystis rosea]